MPLSTMWLEIKSLGNCLIQHLIQKNGQFEYKIIVSWAQTMLESICILKFLANRDLIGWNEFKEEIKKFEVDLRGDIRSDILIKKIEAFFQRVDLLLARIEIPAIGRLWINKMKVLSIMERIDQFNQDDDHFILGMVNTAFKDIQLRKTRSENPKLRGRRKAGIYYTPQQWIQKLVPIVIQNYRDLASNLASKQNFQIKNPKIVDPACGSGDFLLAAYRHMNIVLKNQYNMENMFGIDFDSKGLRLSQINLYLEQLSKEGKLSKQSIEKNFKCVNALFLPFQTKNASFFQKIKNCDIIFMNPPWGVPISRSEAEKLKHHYGISLKNINSFDLFVRFAIRIVREGGLIGAVLPKNFNKSETYAHLRQFILQSCKIIWNVDTGKFPGVMQECILLVLQKTQEISQAERDKNQILINADNYISQGSYSAMPLFSYNTSLSKDEFDVIQKMLQFPKLRDQLEIRRGEEFGAVGRVLQCSSCKRWFPKKRLKTLRCPHCKKTAPIGSFKEKKIISKVPQSTNYEEYLTGKDFDAYKIRSVHYLDRNLEGMIFKPDSFYKDKKIILKRIYSTLCATLDDQGRRASCNVWLLRSKNYSPLYYLALINSTVLKFWWEKVVNHGAKLTTQISKRELNELPVPYPEGKIAEKLIELAQQALLQPENSELYQKIDKLVYSIYSFSDTEKQTPLKWKKLKLI
ncbi:MAG: N-6 DNA methylase [Candidatus Hodarchaeota archaeon]